MSRQPPAHWGQYPSQYPSNQYQRQRGRARRKPRRPRPQPAQQPHANPAAQQQQAIPAPQQAQIQQTQPPQAPQMANQHTGQIGGNGGTVGNAAALPALGNQAMPPNLGQAPTSVPVAPTLLTVGSSNPPATTPAIQPVGQSSSLMPNTQPAPHPFVPSPYSQSANQPTRPLMHLKPTSAPWPGLFNIQAAPRQGTPATSPTQKPLFKSAPSDVPSLYPSVWDMKTRKSLSLLQGPSIEVVVGSSSVSQTWSLPKALLSHYSGFLKAACTRGFKERQDNRILLPEDDPIAFGHFVEWMFYGSFAMLLVFETERHHPYAAAWILGDKLMATDFKNYCMARLHATFIHRSNDSKSLLPSDIHYVCANTVPASTSALRRLYLNVLAINFADSDVVKGAPRNGMKSSLIMRMLVPFSSEPSETRKTGNRSRALKSTWRNSPGRNSKWDSVSWAPDK